ncbi:MMPL family transporter [Amnibacterium sp. CER49]|uniref:MMPL family transporter n=1 Tax=Amnibacterium sp. CER49 TaxID=3039161 RepID=UPI00244840EA|nr:MMPL family transporter [Amnibacterium sp. CER49]MDH2443244.1 MMPL family transporter [Amnibacterium sp. CER49]
MSRQAVPAPAEGARSRTSGRVRVLRVLAALVLVAAWMAVSARGGPTFGTISEVTNNDQTSYLPATAESTVVQNREKDFFGSDTIPVVVLFVRDSGLIAADRQAVAAEASRLRAVHDVTSASPPLPSKDGKALEIIATVRASADGSVVVDALRRSVAGHESPGLRSWVTGPAAIGADFGAGFSGIDGVLLLVALAAVFVILLVVYRSLLLPVVVLLTSGFALTGSILVVYGIGKAGWVTITGQSRGILAILAIGAATDYSLLLVARYREALRTERSHWRALWTAWKRAIEPIAASAATVILAVLCLGFSDLNSNKGLGPVAAVAIAFAFLAAVTALPAILALLRRAAFWPLIPRYYDPAAATADEPRAGRLWSGIGRGVERRPRILWIATTVVLGALALGLTQLQANGVPQTDTLLSPSQSVAGQKELGRHYDAGSGSPVVVLAPQASATRVLHAVEQVPHIASASVYTGTRGGPPAGMPGVPAPQPKVVGGRVLIEATLTVQADSRTAQDAVTTVRSRLRPIAPTAKVGGTSALDLDTNVTAQRDLRTIIPIVLAVIFVVLALLLRSLVAPLLLIATVVLSYGATLGVAALAFRFGFRFPGADPSVPLFGFVFLVALGVDYNIFLMTRVREEAKRRGTRRGIVTGLTATGGVITSAGVVLAATFAALGVIPILFLVQIAFIVAFGVLLDTIVVRTLLVPAASLEIGRALWWPARLWRRDGAASPSGPTS